MKYLHLFVRISSLHLQFVFFFCIFSGATEFIQVYGALFAWCSGYKDLLYLERHKHVQNITADMLHMLSWIHRARSFPMSMNEIISEVCSILLQCYGTKDPRNNLTLWNTHLGLFNFFYIYIFFFLKMSPLVFQ